MFLFGLLVRLVHSTLLTELGELKTIFDDLLILFGVVVDRLTFGALHFDQILLGHRATLCGANVPRKPDSVNR